MAASPPAVFSRSTAERYASDTPIFTGPFAASRRQLDYSWHSHYTPARQRVQDAIITCMLATGLAVEHPWLVHTAGAMGAGKSHAMRWLTKVGAFPLGAFVWVDPDRIKSALPDMPEYVLHNRELAGTLTHRESVLIAEIVEREAMARNKCVLVDGSLRNADWYAAKFKRVRTEWPAYRIAIILVTASPEVVYERAAKRALATGRVVPRDMLDDALTRVPASFEALKPLVDYTATLRNDTTSDGARGVGSDAADFDEEILVKPPVTLRLITDMWRPVADALAMSDLRGGADSPACAAEAAAAAAVAAAAVDEVG